MRRQGYLLAILALLLATALISWALVRTRPQPLQVQELAQPLAVRTGMVEQGELRTTVAEKGRLVPAQEARLLFQAEGLIERRHVVPGRSVVAGELLLDIEDSRQRAAVQRAEARLAATLLAAERDAKLLLLARERVVLLEQEVQRQRSLQKDALSSLERLQQAERELIAAKAEQYRLQHEEAVAGQNEKQLRADLATAQRQQAYCHVVAPFAAIVNEVTVQEGDHAVPGMLAVHLVSADKLDVLLALRGQDLAALSLGSSAKVMSGDGRPSGAATVREIQLVPDERTYTHRLRLRLDDASGLLAGQVVELLLPGPTWQDVPLVPYGALWQEEGKHYLYAVDADDSLRQVEVRLLATAGAMAAVRGVSEGQEIALAAAATMLPGQPIKRISAGQ